MSREDTEIREQPDVESAEVADIFRSYGHDRGSLHSRGFIPLGPYVVLREAVALTASVGITLLALAIFGYVKGQFTGARPARSALHTAVIGGLAAAAAVVIARAIS